MRVLVITAGNSSRTPAPGGTLRVGVLTSGVSLACPYAFCGGGANDPQMTVYLTPYDLERCCLLRTLLSTSGRIANDGGAVLRADLAASLPEVSSDGLTWTFHLRRGIHYGPPLQAETVTAQDFVRSIERALSPSPA